VAIAVAVWIGVLSGRALGAPAFWAGAALAIPFAWLGLRAPDRVGTLALLVACFGAAAARGGASERRLDALAGASVFEEHAVWVRGRVVDHPWREAGEPVLTLRLAGRDGDVPAGARVRLRLPPGTDAEWGDDLEVLARMEPPLARRSPGGYDARAALRAQGIVAQGRALFAHRPTPRRVTVVRATLARWRRAIEGVFEQRLSAQAREIVTPLVIGDRSGLGSELGARLQAAGLTHLLALSGLHVAWMAAVARGAAAAAGRGVARRDVAGALCALLYLALAGPLPSLARAAGHEVFGALARLRDRALDPTQALALTAVALLGMAPGWSGDLGFQLSCAATLGLTTLGPAMSGRLAEWKKPVPVALLRAMTPTLAAQIAALPLLLDRFHALPWTALGANLVAVPVSELLLAAAWLGALLELAAPGLAAWTFAACEALAAAMRAVASMAAAAPCALVPTGHHPVPVWLASVGAGLLAWAVTRRRERTGATSSSSSGRALVLGGAGTLACALAIALAVTAPEMRPPPGRWWLIALDVGQGDALAIGFEDGWWLVDAGPRAPRFDAGAGVVLPFLRWAPVRRLRVLTLTHDHGDHTGGAPAVLAGLPCDTLRVRAGMKTRFAVGRTRVRTAGRGDTLRLEPLVVVKWPSRGEVFTDENAGSLVLEIGEGGGRALLAADVDSTVEASLDVGPDLAVLKVAHHGAARSTGREWLSRVRPRMALVSCGRRNPFGHPDARTLARLESAGARVRRIDRSGTVWLEFDRGGVRDIEWRRNPDASALRGDARETRVVGACGPLAAAAARW